MLAPFLLGERRKMEWEYKILEVKPEGSSILNYERLEIKLNVLGKSDWELVEATSVISPGLDIRPSGTQTSRVYFIFKREVKER